MRKGNTIFAIHLFLFPEIIYFEAAAYAGVVDGKCEIILGWFDRYSKVQNARFIWALKGGDADV